MTKKTIHTTCPHCGLKDSWYLEEGKHFLLCDCDDKPGCEEYFVVEVEFRATYKIFTLTDVTIPPYEKKEEIKEFFDNELFTKERKWK